MPVIEEIVEEPPIDDVEPGRGDECSMICDQKLEWGERLKAAGNAWFKRGDLDKAIGKYRRGTKIFEMLYAVFKDEEEGAQAANERCYVAAAPLYNNLALCLYKQGKWKECADACTDNLDLTPTDVKSLLRRAAARAEIDMWEEADDDIAKALRLDPDAKWVKQSAESTKKTLRELRIKQAMKDHAVIGGKIPDMNLYDAADVAPTGEAFPHTGRRAHSVTTVKDVKQELDDMEEEDAEETCKRKTDFYNGMIKSGKWRLVNASGDEIKRECDLNL